MQFFHYKGDIEIVLINMNKLYLIFISLWHYLLMFNNENYMKQKSRYTIGFKSRMTWNYVKVSFILVQIETGNLPNTVSLHKM